MGEGSSGGIAVVAAEAWSNQEIPFHVASEKAKQAHCQLLRDIFWNPFRKVSIDCRRLSARVKQLAEAICEERVLDRLPILADALEEAGCAYADLVNHCRQSGVHVRGCWVVDLLLGKE